MATVTVIEKVADSHTQASKSFFAMADDVADYKKKYTDGESIVKVCDSLKLTIPFFCLLSLYLRCHLRAFSLLTRSVRSFLISLGTGIQTIGRPLRKCTTAIF